MIRVSVAQAKQHLADLLGRVAYGREQVLITRRGKPMAILMPPQQARRLRMSGKPPGWLDNDDPFFQAIERIVDERLKHRPRILS